MTIPVFEVNERFVTDVERTAFSMLPKLCASRNPGALGRYAIQLADILGSPGEFKRYISGSAQSRQSNIDHLLKTLNENVELLVNKTWVEESEEKPKANLLEELKSFGEDFEKAKTVEAFRKFVNIARSIAHLLFGQQSREDDFLEYCFRIDPKFGLFFWYIAALEWQVHQPELETEVLATELLIGIYVLSSF